MNLKIDGMWSWDKEIFYIDGVPPIYVMSRDSRGEIIGVKRDFQLVSFILNIKMEDK